MSDAERKQGSAPTDPSGIDEPHDVLAAEEFGIPTREGRIPSDPTGIREPHDVLAAEEFAMPAGGDDPHAGADAGDRLDPRAFLPLALALLVLVVLLRRRG